MVEYKEINASLSCMGYGYTVAAVINGVDVGVKGGQSEAMRLFSVIHPMLQEATPDMRSRLFVLKPGKNSLQLDFKKTGGPTDRLTFELYMLGQDEPFLSFVTADASGTYEKTFIL